MVIDINESELNNAIDNIKISIKSYNVFWRDQSKNGKVYPVTSAITELQHEKLHLEWDRKHFDRTYYPQSKTN